jgi:hypothetical protein
MIDPSNPWALLRSIQHLPLSLDQKMFAFPGCANLKSRALLTVPDGRCSRREAATNR